METIASLGPWAWIIAGIVLATAEAVLPGVFLLWFGLAAVATGLVGFAVPLHWTWGLVVFGAFAVVFSVLGQRMMRRGTGDSDQPLLSRRGERLVGRVFVLAEPIVNGRGRLKIDDSQWLINGPDMIAGAKVRVTGVDGATLQVEAANLAG